jgi:hypothetical protein
VPEPLSLVSLLPQPANKVAAIVAHNNALMIFFFISKILLLIPALRQIKKTNLPPDACIFVDVFLMSRPDVRPDASP